VLGITDINTLSRVGSIGASTQCGTAIKTKRDVVRSMREASAVENRIELPAGTVASRPRCESLTVPARLII
jgi:hypothetical protein